MFIFVLIKQKSMKKKVLFILKPKVKELGFSKKEVESIAARIADNLNIEEEATEDEINESISSAIDSVIPYLQVSQSAANRTIQAYKSSLGKEGENDDDDDDTTPPVKKSPKKVSTEDELLSTIKQMREEFVTLRGEMATMREEKTKNTRLESLKKVVDNTGAYGKSVIRSFSRTTFKDDDDFETYLEEIKAEVEEINNERISNGLDALTPPGTNGAKRKREEEPMSDEEIDMLGDSMS